MKVIVEGETFYVDVIHTIGGQVMGIARDGRDDTVARVTCSTRDKMKRAIGAALLKVVRDGI